MSLPLAGKVAIITGSSRGIGAAVARRLAADGATVVVNYNGSKDVAEELAQTITAEGPGKAVAIQADMSSLAEGKELVEETVRRFGRLDILALNAAIVINGTLDTIDEQQFDNLFAVNAKIPLFMVQAASKYLQTGGRVFFFSSNTTKTSSVRPNYLIYAMTKGTVQEFTRVLAKDLGTRGITVNAIAPGATDTEMWRTWIATNGGSQVEETVANLFPQKRIGKPEEVAAIVALLSREEAGWVNGQTIHVSGGYTV